MSKRIQIIIECPSERFKRVVVDELKEWYGGTCSSAMRNLIRDERRRRQFKQEAKHTIKEVLIEIIDKIDQKNTE